MEKREKKTSEIINYYNNVYTSYSNRVYMHGYCSSWKFLDDYTQVYMS